MIMNCAATKIPVRKISAIIKEASLKHTNKNRTVYVRGWEDRDGRGGEACIKDIVRSKKNLHCCGSEEKVAWVADQDATPRPCCERAGATGPVNVQR